MTREEKINQVVTKFETIPSFGIRHALVEMAEWEASQHPTMLSGEATKLLDRFVRLYGESPLVGSMIEPGMKLWRDYYEYTGEHMILTDEGWEPGSVKKSYIDEFGPEAILDEVNAPS